jgi:hypothetical protein
MMLITIVFVIAIHIREKSLVTNLHGMMMWQFIYNVVNGDNFINNLFTNQVKFSKYKDSCIYHHC